MVKRIEMLAKQIETNVPGAKVDFTLFPSGAAMLVVKRAGCLFVLSFLPQGHFSCGENHQGCGYPSPPRRFAKGKISSPGGSNGLLRAAGRRHVPGTKRSQSAEGSPSTLGRRKSPAGISAAVAGHR